MGLRGLLSFLTALPLGGAALEEAADSFHLVPLAGLLVGLASGAVGALVAHISPAAAGMLYTAAYIAVTGALHLDGYADMQDALASGLRGEEALRILKDPRRGAHSIAMLSASLLAGAGAASALASLGPLALVVAAAAVHVGASEAMFTAALSSNPPPYRGLSALFHEAARRPGALRANLVVLAAASFAVLQVAALLGIRAFLASSTGLAATLLAGSYAARRATLVLGFVNGDALGYAYETARATALVVAAAAAALYALVPWLS